MQRHSKTYEAQQSPIDKFCIDIAIIIGGKDYKAFLAPVLPMTSTELRTTNPNAFLIVDGNRVDVMELIDQGLDRAREDLHPPLNIPAQAKEALFARIPEAKQIETDLLNAMKGENDFLPLLTQLGTALKEKNRAMCNKVLDQFNNAFDTLTNEEQDTIKGYHVTPTETFGQVLNRLEKGELSLTTQVALGNGVLAMAKKHHRYLDELAYLHVTPYQHACELANKVEERIGKSPLAASSIFRTAASQPAPFHPTPSTKAHS